MQISEAGLRFIEANEGYRASPYWDVDGWSWGYGHHVAGGSQSEPPAISVSEEDATALMLTDLGPVEAALNDLVPAICTQNQFDSLCDFAYNLGVGSLKTMLGHGWEQIPVQMPRWNHSGGQVNAGLTARRENEVELFNGEAA
jgi:GH24 family phage-related lysozyme (muramidase)